MKLISIVIPCYNEEAVIETSLRRVCEVMDGQKAYAWEIIFVDDGSEDSTWEKIINLTESNKTTVGIKLSRNFGHQMAIMAGIEAATGDAVVIMDGDLQDPPEVIPEFIEKWEEGYPVVYGKRRKRKGESIFKRATAGIFYRMLNMTSEVDIPLDAGDFRLMDRKVTDHLLNMPERARFLRGMVAWLGSGQCGVEYDRDKRYAGSSKYPLGKMIRFAADGMLSFSIAPLKFVAIIGLASFLLSVAGIIYAVSLRVLTSYWVSGWAALFVAAMFFGGLQLLTLGLIGEYIASIFTESKNRPLYIVEEVSGSFK